MELINTVKMKASIRTYLDKKGFLLVHNVIDDNLKFGII